MKTYMTSVPIFCASTSILVQETCVCLNFISCCNNPYRKACRWHARKTACFRIHALLSACKCRVPGVNQHRVPKPVGVLQQPDWCQNIFLQEDLQVVYVPVRGSVYGFRVQDGERINDWEDIHKQTITAVVHPPGSNHVITGSHDLTAKVSFCGA